MSLLEEDDFVFVSKEGLTAEDDAVSITSSRSSGCLVEDPSRDPILLQEEEGEETLSKEVSVESVEENAKPESPKPNPKEGEKAEEHEQLEAVRKEVLPAEQLRYVCSICSCDIAASSDIIWEGFMGANKPAYLFGKAWNLEPLSEPRQQHLSTGRFLLQDVCCRKCSNPFGWTYVKALSQGQEYKEGATIIQQSLLTLKGGGTKEQSLRSAA